MKVECNCEEQTETRTCPICGYKQTKEYKKYGRILEGDESFIEMEGFQFHSTNRDSWHPSHDTHTVYACPKCGVLQIQI